MIKRAEARDKLRRASETIESAPLAFRSGTATRVTAGATRSFVRADQAPIAAVPVTPTLLQRYVPVSALSPENAVSTWVGFRESR